MLLGGGCGGWVSSTQSLVTDLRPYAVIGVVSSPSWPWFFFFFFKSVRHCARDLAASRGSCACVLDSPHCASRRLPRSSGRGVSRRSATRLCFTRLTPMGRYIVYISRTENPG